MVKATLANWRLRARSRLVRRDPFAVHVDLAAASERQGKILAALSAVHASGFAPAGDYSRSSRVRALRKQFL